MDYTSLTEISKASMFQNSDSLLSLLKINDLELNTWSLEPFSINYNPYEIWGWLIPQIQFSRPFVSVLSAGMTWLCEALPYSGMGCRVQGRFNRPISWDGTVFIVWDIGREQTCILLCKRNKLEQNMNNNMTSYHLY